MASEFQVRPMPNEDNEITRRTHWHSQKRGRNLSITDEGWKLLGELARHVGNRSEAIEVMARYVSEAGTDLSKKRDKLLRDQTKKVTADKAEQVLQEVTASALHDDMQGVDLSACTFEPPAECSLG